MKRFLKAICIILVVATMAAIPVAAEEQVEPRASLFFHSFSTYIYQKTDTKFEVWFDLVAVERMSEIGASSIKVQRSADNSNWETMFTYLPEYYSQMIAENTISHGACVPYTGTQGYYYRAIVTFYAKNSTGTGELSRYTQTVYLQPAN